MKRSAGILMPITSLPSPYGIGTLGKKAYEFADFLHEAGQKYWQMLPLGPTGFGDSPYQSFSSFAGNPYMIDLDMLIADKLLTKKDLKGIDFGKDPEKVDYGKVYESRNILLPIAKENGWERDKKEVEAFVSENRWLPDYALYMACKKHFKMQPWISWQDKKLRFREPETLEKYRTELKEDIELYTYIQFLFYKQWKALRAYLEKKEIKTIGDIPIYVPLDSADVWSEPQFFQLDENYMPEKVAGVPPDYFSKDGQLWGNPIYDYNKMQSDGFGWWIRRIDGATKLYDMIRIDHFRGFSEYWAVPYGEKTAKNGQWVKGPGMDLIGPVTGWFRGVSFIAEDLGAPTESLRQLLKDSGLPGMKVLEFAFDSSEESNFLPHSYTSNCICYTGTHDNATLIEWLEDAKPEDVLYACDYLGIESPAVKTQDHAAAAHGAASHAAAKAQDHVAAAHGAASHAAAKAQDHVAAAHGAAKAQNHAAAAKTTAQLSAQTTAQITAQTAAQTATQITAQTAAQTATQITAQTAAQTAVTTGAKTGITTAAQTAAGVKKSGKAGKKEKTELYITDKNRSDFVWAVIRDGQKSVAELFVAQIQDYLELGKGSRLNMPSTASGNWAWRLKDGSLTKALAEKINHITKLYGR